MTDKTFWIWPLMIVIGIWGCEKPMRADQSATAAKEKKTSLLPGEQNATYVLRTPNLPSYNWPADFKLPLIINIETPEVPKEIQNPSPPIEEDKKSIDEEKKSVDEEANPIEEVTK
jgi:hypothetical protein